MKITSKVLMAVAVATTAIAVAVPALTGAQNHSVDILHLDG